MNVFVVGTRGIPHIQGGVETHCEELYTQLAGQKDVNITIIRRSVYTEETRNLHLFNGVHLKTLYSPPSKSWETIVHTFLAVVYAGFKRPDILHIHAVGPNLFAPLAKLFGLKVVMTDQITNAKNGDAPQKLY